MENNCHLIKHMNCPNNRIMKKM